MPYGLPKKHSNKKNNRWMERCVPRVMESKTLEKVKNHGEKKGRAISICKKQLEKMNYDPAKASLAVIVFLMNENEETSE